MATQGLELRPISQGIKEVAPVRTASLATFIALVVLATLLMGSGFIPSKLLIQQGFPPLSLAGWRFVVAALAVLPLAVWQAGSLRAVMVPTGLRFADVRLVALLGLVQTALVMGLATVGMVTVPAQVAAILLFTNPIWVAVAGHALLGDRLPIAGMLGLGLGLVGIALAVGLDPRVETSLDWAGAPLVLLGAMCWGAATLITKRARTALVPLALNFWQMMVGAMVLLAAGHFGGEHWPTQMTGLQWAEFLWLAIPASGGSFSLWYLVLARGDASRASSYLFLAPLFAVLLAVPFLGASLTWIQGIGGLLIGVGVWLINRRVAIAGPMSLDRHDRPITRHAP